ncbi:MAG: tetratricopeptide repeat protein [Planctomycetes bacterium]|nr:tetratricopeptide repeat protein [Planctomycetota bacterium]
MSFGRFQNLAAVVTIICIACSTNQASAQSSDLRDYFSASGLLQRGMYDLAIVEYRKFLDAHPEHEKATTARYGLGVAHYRLEQYEHAISQLSQISDEIDFAYAAETLTLLGQSHLALRQFADATASFGKVVANLAEHDLADDAAALQAESLYRDGKYERVKEPGSMLISRWPKSLHRERAELFWGLSDMARKDYPEAAARFKGMSQRFTGGKHADQVALLLGQCLHRSNAITDAAKQYKTVIAKARREYLPEALYGLAMIQHGQRKLDSAGELLDRLLLEFSPHDLDSAAKLLRGRVWFDKEEYQKAYDLFAQVQRVKSEHQDDAAYWLAKCELRRDKPGIAANKLKDAIAAYPKSDLLAEMIYDRAVALLRIAQPDEAMNALGMFRNTFPEHKLSANALHLMAATEHQQRRYDSSLQLCAQFATKYSNHQLAASIAFLKAENLFLSKDYERAANAYESFNAAYPDDGQSTKATFRLGMSQYHRSLFKEADEILTPLAKGSETPVEFAKALLAVGDIHFQQGRWEKAQQYLGDYISLGSDLVSVDDALLKLSLSQARLEDYKSALNTLDELLRGHPDSPHYVQGVFERGQVLVALKHPEQAQQAFEQLLSEAGDSRFAVHALNHLGAIASQRGSFKDAAEYYKQAVALDPGDELKAEALFQQGQALVSAKKYQQAANVFADVISAYPSHSRLPQSAALRAISLARQGKFEIALAEILKIEKEHGSKIKKSLLTAVWYEKAWCLRELDRSNEAQQVYLTILNSGKDQRLIDHALLELAELESQDEQYAVAAGRLKTLREKAVQTNKVAADLLERATYRLGVCEFRLDNFPQAIQIFEEFLDTFTESDLVASSSLLCGEALFKTGSYEMAAKHLTHVVDYYSGDDTFGPSLLRLGECLAILQRWKKSEEIFRIYLNAFNDSDLWYQAQFGTAWALENQQKLEQAIVSYRPVIDRHQGPTAARAQFQTGECLFALKRLDEAVSELLKVDILYAYPQWSAAALYEAGRCFQELGNPTNARKQFELVRTKHKDSKWAQLAEARLTELSQASLPGD